MAAHQWCEPPRYPDSLDERWTCPECGHQYEAFDVLASGVTPLPNGIKPGTLGWRTERSRS